MTAQSIDRFEFHADKLKGLSIFRIVDWPMPVLVTREFVDRVHDAGLNGFRFRQVWPLPRGANWRMLDRDGPTRHDATRGVKPTRGRRADVSSAGPTYPGRASNRYPIPGAVMR